MFPIIFPPVKVIYLPLIVIPFVISTFPMDIEVGDPMLPIGAASILFCSSSSLFTVEDCLVHIILPSFRSKDQVF